MIHFPENFYVDVRIEEVYETLIRFTLGKLEENRVREFSAAFIRLFDGQRWYFSSTTEVNNIPQEIKRLAAMATPNHNILNHPVISKIPITTEQKIQFEKSSVDGVPAESKIGLLKSCYELVDSSQYVAFWTAIYKDIRKVKKINSSKGTNLVFDTQNAGFRINFKMVNGEKNLSETFSKSGSAFDELQDSLPTCRKHIEECEMFLQNAESVKPGSYTVVLSPEAAGVFAHESFGHKSEADFMVGDENMKKEWAIGTKVGADILSIVDSGLEAGSGYVPFDDEGSPAGKTFLVKNGILTGRLHSASTAAELGENVTGNARSIGFEFEPIVRMTTTYILVGDLTKEELFQNVSDGLFVNTIKHGSGMSTFTIAPSLAYKIENGRITDPVNISVISGNVMKTLGEIDGLSDTVELKSFVGGGCGKMEQFPLLVGFGGPYVRVKELNVQ